MANFPEQYFSLDDGPSPKFHEEIEGEPLPGAQDFDANEAPYAVYENPIEAPCCNLVTLIELLLEYIALVDFIFDLIITYQLIYSKNAGWAVSTVLSMLAPFLVSSVQLIQFLLHKVTRRDGSKPNLCLLLTSWLSISPILPAYMLFMDILFILNATILKPLADVFNISLLHDFINGSYELLFQMKPHEVSGFRRMRTITQFFFETKIQICI